MDSIPDLRHPASTPVRRWFAFPTYRKAAEPWFNENNGLNKYESLYNVLLTNTITFFRNLQPS
jgi:hypothetical protein